MQQDATRRNKTQQDATRRNKTQQGATRRNKARTSLTASAEITESVQGDREITEITEIIHGDREITEITEIRAASGLGEQSGGHLRDLRGGAAARRGHAATVCGRAWRVRGRRRWRAMRMRDIETAGRHRRS